MEWTERELTERELAELLHQRAERLHARAFLADDSGAYRAGISDALSAFSEVLGRRVDAGRTDLPLRRA